jgi:hypothetical protein
MPACGPSPVNRHAGPAGRCRHRFAPQPDPECDYGGERDDRHHANVRVRPPPVRGGAFRHRFADKPALRSAHPRSWTDCFDPVEAPPAQRCRARRRNGDESWRRGGLPALETERKKLRSAAARSERATAATERVGRRYLDTFGQVPDGDPAALRLCQLVGRSRTRPGPGDRSPAGPPEATKRLLGDCTRVARTLLLRLAAVTAANDRPDHERDDGREGKHRPDANSGCGASSCQTTPAFRSTCPRLSRIRRRRPASLDGGS